MNVEIYEYGDGLGYIVDPESDTKEITVIIIGKQTVKCNPRPAVIYLTAGKVDENYLKLSELKEYCAENKVAFLCPKSNDLEKVAKTYKYIVKNAKQLNLNPDELSVKGDMDNLEAAREFVEYLLDEYDVEVEAADAF